MGWNRSDSGLKNMAIVGVCWIPRFRGWCFQPPKPAPVAKILGSHSRRFRVSFRQPGFWMSGSWYPFNGTICGPMIISVNMQIAFMEHLGNVHKYNVYIHVYVYVLFACDLLYYTILYNIMYDKNKTYHASHDSCPLSMLQHLLSVLLSIESRNWNGLNGWPPFKPTWLQLLDFVTTFSTKNTFAVRHQVTSSLSTRTSIWSAGQGLLAV